MPRYDTVAKSKGGHPVKRKIQIDATAEEIAKAIFAAVRPPDSSKRTPKTRRVSEN